MKSHDLPMYISSRDIALYSKCKFFYKGYDEYPCYLAPCENSSAIHDTLY